MLLSSPPTTNEETTHLIKLRDDMISTKREETSAQTVYYSLVGFSCVWAMENERWISGRDGAGSRSAGPERCCTSQSDVRGYADQFWTGIYQ